jgi:hypothetical protein
MSYAQTASGSALSWFRYAKYDARFPVAAAMNTSVAAIQNGPYLPSASGGARQARRVRDER